MSRIRRPAVLVAWSFVLTLGAGPIASATTNPRAVMDAAAVGAPAARLAALDRLSHDPVLSRIGLPRHVDERYGVPSLLIGQGGPESRATPGASFEQAARQHLTRLAPYYRLSATDVRNARLQYVNASGKGGVIVAFRQEVAGIPVFREETKVLLDRKGSLIAVAGSIPGSAEAAKHPTFRLDVTDAIAAALTDLTGAPVSRGAVQRVGAAVGGYETFTVANVPQAKLTPQPFRARPVLFRVADGLLPAYHVELTTEDEAPTYVIAAEDGRVLLQHDRIAYDAFSYRVWAESGGLGRPHDGPQGLDATPHPTGVPDNYQPGFIAPSLITLQNGPISTSDPWLAPGATTTSGNNVDAYADLSAPDGFSAGDLRASTTSSGAFDRTYDVNQDPGASSAQRMADVTQLFYDTNFFHDWYYNVGFNEAAGNAQASNFGRGGVEGDALHAETEDYSGTNNANMNTPADGGSPRMQMYLWNPVNVYYTRVNSPAAIAGSKSFGIASTNPKHFSITGDVARPFPGTFTATTSTLTVGSSPRLAQIADVSGDGRPDLIVSNASSNNVGVMLSDGSGGFLPAVTYATGNAPRMTVTPDLNHDGLPDLVSANLVGGNITIRLGTGGGAFGASTSLTSASGANSIVVGRFNGDANDDVVVGNAASNNVSVFLGDGAGSFAPRVLYTMGSSPISVAVGDLNGDGNADLVAANFGAGSIFMSIRLGTGTGTFGAVVSDTIGNSPQGIALADLNGDGKLDAIAANTGNSTVSVAFGNGLGTFGTPVMYALPAAPIGVTAADFNGDGIIDVLATEGTASGTVSLLANDGAGVLGAPQNFAVGNTPQGVTLGDVTGDGQPDILVANSGSGNVTLLTGTVTPSASTCPPFANTLTGRLALIDFVCAPATVGIDSAAARGAVGVVFVNVSGAGNIINFTLTSPPSVPAVTISKSNGTLVKNALNTGPVNMTVAADYSVQRTSGLDNLIVAHEWAHFLSNRLIGNASGLINPQGKGMGEGWSDFNALLLAVRPEDALAASNPNWAGTFSVGGFAAMSSTVPSNVFYFGIRRYPYSTDFAKNPLTFKHIQDGVALPAGPPINGTGGSNAEVHNTGEVWCNVLWECYASLLRDTPRLTAAEARDRMRRYLVQSLELTPNSPTFLEARDALLMAAYATDLADYQDFCTAFARRGMGTAAVAPDRNSSSNSGVVESYTLGGDLRFVSVTTDDSLQSCDHDGFVDSGEDGHVRVTLMNAPASVNLSATTATVTSSDPSLEFPDGNVISLPASSPTGTTSASVHVRGGGSGMQALTIQVQYNDPGLLVPGPRTASAKLYFNVDAAASATDDFEVTGAAWTEQGTFLSAGTSLWQWMRADTTLNSVYWGTDPGSAGEQSLVSPPLVVGASNFSFTFQHAYSFEGYPSFNEFVDGGVVEISTDDGATWTDVGSAMTPAYPYTLYTQGVVGNPLSGRPAFSGNSPGYPARITETVNLGTTYAGQTVRIRFRIGADESSGDPGWIIDNVAFTGITNTPFQMLVAEPNPCSPVAVEPVSAPRELAFAIAGANPSRGTPGFRFALPQSGHVTITMHDVSGRRLATLADGEYSAGTHQVSWNTRLGKPGVYFARMLANGRALSQRVVVMAE